ncbi:FtsX-like permease family protein [Paenibacillus sp. SN-8-1]|uniref:FtsX-like permease family protein n=1 Tax=Paenibacillus sp. SN-8-1 TaxID=3435409 RepID=UPI003D9A8159
MTAILLAISLIFLTMVYIIQRLSEFATKYVLGWTANRIIGSFVLEMAITAILGWMIGLLGYVLILNVLSPMFVNVGLIVDSSIIGVLPWTLPLPITLIIASYLISAKKLSRKEVVRIFDV